MTIHAINTRNQLPGKVVEIVTGQVVSEVLVETQAGIISSVVTTRSIKNMGLKLGHDVIAVFKATEVLLAAP